MAYVMEERERELRDLSTRESERGEDESEREVRTRCGKRERER